MVDANVVASRLVEGVFARLDAQQHVATTREERASAFQKVSQELLNNKQIDKDVAPIMLKLIEAAKEDLTADQRSAAQAAAQEAQTKAVDAELGRMIERYARTSSDPKLIRALAPTIKKEAYDGYNSDSSLIRRYQNSGEVNWDRFDELVVGAVKGYVKEAGTKEDKPAPGGPAMKNSAPSGASAPTQVLDSDDMSERQREIYNSQVSFGMKTAGLTREKAQERAIQLISNAENKLKSKKG